MKEVQIEKNDAGQRFDKFMQKAFPQLPASMLYKGIRKNCVRRNGKHLKDASVKLAEGDVLSLYFKDEFLEAPKKEQAFLHSGEMPEIVYEDENILLVDKKPGIVVHEDDEGATDTLIARILNYLYKKGEYQPDAEHSFAPALCNRIDRNTGGIVIAAKNAESLRILNQKIKDRELTKQYLCLVEGYLPRQEDTLFGYLFKDEKKKRVFVSQKSTPGSKSIRTRYRVLKAHDNQSLLEVDLLTGRTHQIRAHFASIGHPLVGDGKYGKLPKDAKRRYQALYSYRLTFSFTTDAGILSYLDGKSFSVREVDFAKNF
ncbi:MAG: RluA family pseudouridine synthase [Ruminococcaceae bacterium]|nr:RluA family pseudouridine synthase [Oscillospiraceae bacterium]